MAIGTTIKRLRVSRGITRAQLADAAGLRWHSLWRIEQGVGTPKVETLRRIADALGVGIGEILSAQKGR